jgi:hypothetical protein
MAPLLQLVQAVTLLQIIIILHIAIPAKPTASNAMIPITVSNAFQDFRFIQILVIPLAPPTLIAQVFIIQNAIQSVTSVSLVLIIQTVL